MNVAGHEVDYGYVSPFASGLTSAAVARPSTNPLLFRFSGDRGRSQSEHWNVRGPSLPGGNARIRYGPQ